MYRIINEKNSESAELILSGGLTIQNCTEIKTALTELYDTANKITINHGEVELLDLSYFQILSALRNSMEKDGKILKIKGSNSEPFKLFFNESGFPKPEWLTDAIEQNSGETK